MFLKLNSTSGSLPTSQYNLVDKDNEIGFIQIRHQASSGNGVPINMASHIYYEIEPEWRNKGYGNKILELGLKEVKKIGLKEVFITCKEDNIASKKIIENNGGIFIEKGVIENGTVMLKYKISVD